MIDSGETSSHDENNSTCVAPVKKEIVFPNEPGLTIDISDDELEVIREIIAYDSDEDPEQMLEIESQLLLRPKTIVKAENDSFDLVTGKMLVEINVSSFHLMSFILMIICN